MWWMKSGGSGGGERRRRRPGAGAGAGLNRVPVRARRTRPQSSSVGGARAGKWRVYLVEALLAVSALALLGRAAHLNFAQGEFLQKEGVARQVRPVVTHAPRGVIRDRHGTELALSTAIESIWAEPRVAFEAREHWPDLADVLGMPPEVLERRLLSRIDSNFVYLRRHAIPDVAEPVRAMGLPGIHFEREYRSYYPGTEITSHVVGFTDIDGEGREGVELAFDRTLTGVDGREEVIRDNFPRREPVEHVRNVRQARPGSDVHLTLDLRVQSFAYHALKAAVQRHEAVGGSVVVVDALTGDILAMVNQPSYNPNKVAQRSGDGTRNRAVTDLIEPGSTVKPFVIAAALTSGAFTPDTVIDTSPGRFRIGKYEVKDRRDLGELDIMGVLRQSSNVGVTRIALETPPEQMWDTFEQVGFGAPTGSGATGESFGVFERRRGDIYRATFSYGYGFQVTALQLARAYTAFANGGEVPTELRLVRDVETDGSASPPAVERTRAMPPEVAREMLVMLENVVEGEDGTGHRARIPGYRVAGKTGTSKKVKGGVYTKEYMSLFVGLAPASAPRFVAVVIVDTPRQVDPDDRFYYYGGKVAAPVFREVMADVLRLHAIPHDSPHIQLRDAVAENYSVTPDIRW